MGFIELCLNVLIANLSIYAVARSDRVQLLMSLVELDYAYRMSLFHSHFKLENFEIFSFSNLKWL